jgi:hypothetical protein
MITFDRELANPLDVDWNALSGYLTVVVSGISSINSEADAVLSNGPRANNFVFGNSLLLLATRVGISLI